MEEQHEKLKDAWSNGERVTALKISIQCAKILSDTSVPQFYPSMYVCVRLMLSSYSGEIVQDF